MANCYLFQSRFGFKSTQSQWAAIFPQKATTTVCLGFCFHPSSLTGREVTNKTTVIAFVNRIFTPEIFLPFFAINVSRNNGYCICSQNLFRFISSMTNICSNYAARNNSFCIRPRKHHSWDLSAIFAIIVSQNNRYAWHWSTNFTSQIFRPFFAIQYSSDKSV